MARSHHAPLVPVTLVTGPETFLADRAVRGVVAAARRADPEADVTDMSARDLTPAAMAEYVSPSLFATRRVLVVRDLQDADEALATALRAAVAAAPADIHLVLVHAGGTKGKALVDAVRAGGAHHVTCDRVVRAEDQLDFVRAEVAAAGGSIDDDAARSLVEAVGADLRGLASAAGQLASDAENGRVDRQVVSTYFEGRAEVKGWVVADRAVEGRVALAVEQLRWAVDTGTDAVLITAALAAALRNVGRLAGTPRSFRDADVARDLGVPSWKVRVLRQQARGWTSDSIARAIRAVAAADLQVKGGANDPVLALTRAVITVGTARSTG